MIVEEAFEFLPLAAFGVPLAGGVLVNAVETAGRPASYYVALSWQGLPPELRDPLLGLEPRPHTRPKLYVGQLSETLRFSGVKVDGGTGGLFEPESDTMFDRNGTYLPHEWGHLIDHAWKKRVEGAATRSRISDEPLWDALWVDAKALAPSGPGPTRYGMTNKREFFAELMQAWMRRNAPQLLVECSSSVPLTRRAIALLAARFPYAGMSVIVNWNFG